MFVATRLLQTDLRVGTADNDINALKTNGSIPEGYRVNHYLTDNDAWFLTTDVPNGMKHFVRTAMQTSMGRRLRHGQRALQGSRALLVWRFRSPWDLRFHPALRKFN
jgi:hypothetical protein